MEGGTRDGKGAISCLYWGLLPLLVGVALPLLMVYWVLSHRLRLPLSQIWPLVGAAYTNPLDGMGGFHQWLFLPFCVLAVFFFVFSLSASRRAMIMVAAGSLGLTCLCMVPQVIHLLKETYIHDDSPPFIEFHFLFIGIEPLFLIGVCCYLVFAWRRLSHTFAAWKDPSRW